MLNAEMLYREYRTWRDGQMSELENPALHILFRIVYQMTQAGPFRSAWMEMDEESKGQILLIMYVSVGTSLRDVISRLELSVQEQS